ncbi:acyl-CoA dehydrogenase [bacterium]|nr:acyl-CoA dehydrogenase [bacterium]
MAGKFVSERNIKFLLYDVFDIESLTNYPYFSDHNKNTFNMVLKAASKLAKDKLFPVFEEMDRSQPELVNGEVVVHPSVRDILHEYAEGGWISSIFPYDVGGEQLPSMITEVCHFIFACANYSAGAYSGLTSGAAGLIISFGNKALYDRFVPNMFSGKWQGTMALTEPEAGSSLSDIRTVAEPTDGDYYTIKGQKVFISAGDHNCVENVVHLMLAKIKGAPPGVKGISLFVVPKKRMENGQLVSNDVTTSGVFHKMGYKGCPIVQLDMGDAGDCRGWLVGEPNNGLRYMFQMMNEARIDVGLGANAMATAAYYASLEYSKSRLQGRRASEKEPTKPQVPIIEHADVKRMLLFQRAINEGALALLMQCSKYVDLLQVLPEVEKENIHLLLELLTPVAKSYPSEMGIQAISQGLQCLGGSGYCDDYPLEQYYRDARIHPIHEGTTGIQGMDILGRKVIMKNGRAFVLFQEEVVKTVQAAEAYPELLPFSKKLADALQRCRNITAHLLTVAQSQGIEVFLADAVLYLEMFGIVTIAWQWLKQGVAIQKQLGGKVSKNDLHFFTGKMVVLRFFYSYELPKISGLEERLLESDGLTVKAGTDCFID